ncbi:MAG: DUF362 domain-containing protein [Desulfobacterales bacterium]|nr:MAG: DUF362 domain-containing protein [Desulfobacterales bacterium]
MKLDKPITRRESIQNLMQIGRGIALAGAASWMSPLSVFAVQKSGFVVEGIGQSLNYSINDLTRRVFEAAGGINKFVSKGDVVVIKANLSWASKPEFAATTNPEVLKAIIELCQEAGAKKVRIADNTIDDAHQCFSITGAEKIAKITGAELVYPRSSLMKRMKIQGNIIDVEWPVFIPLVENDKIINLPVAKTHILSTLTLGMKNWIGGVDGNRWMLHNNIHESIVDLSQFFRPTITVIDAIRIMARNGPRNGNLEDVAEKNTLILSNDPVAADARATLMFNLKPVQIGYIWLGQKWGLGTYDAEKLVYKKVVV